MPNRKNIVWYQNGQYQGGTPDACDSINLFDLNTKIIAIYQKQPDGKHLFLTTCELTVTEEKHLLYSKGNFLTDGARNKQNPINPNIKDDL